MENTSPENGTSEQLMHDFRSLVQGYESCLGSSLTQDYVKAAKEKFESKITSAKDEIFKYQDKIVEKTKDVSKAADDYVHENPWFSIAVCAGIGLLIGVAVARK
jgi:ElaB/YqjD/DUF883 family membrane-anchored ribosome-binding protein